jgi:hypothetical protein
VDIHRLLKMVVSSNQKDRDLAEALVDALIQDEQTETLLQINAQLTGYLNHFDLETTNAKERIATKINVYLNTVQ